MGQVSNLAASREILSSWRVTAMGQVSNLATSREILSVLLEGYRNGAGK